MIRNYLYTAFRNFSKAFGHVSTNIIGLGLGIAMCIVSFLLSAYNSEFNKCYNKDTTKSIYRLEYSNIENDKKVYYGSVEYAYTNFLEKDIPGIESVLYFFGRQSMVKINNERFGEFINFCNEDFIKSFPYKLIRGSYSPFNDVDAIYISDELANKYFGEESPIGKPIEVLVKDTEGGVIHYIVKGVFSKAKENSSFNYVDIFTNFDNLYRSYNIDKLSEKTGVVIETYVKVSDPEFLSNKALIAKLGEMAHMLSKEGNVEFQFTPFTKIHKSSNNGPRVTYTNTDIPGGILITFNLMSIMILLIACFNYTIYAFTFAGKRLKEIGLRKVSGGHRKHIIFQFLSESLILSVVSTLVGLLLAQLMLPIFDRIFDGFPYYLRDVNGLRLMIFLVGITLMMAIVSGFYPAFYVSRLNPSAILAKNAKLKQTGWVTHTLILFQQVVIIIGLGASIVFTDNVYYQENMDFGYDTNNLLTIQGLNASKESDVFIESVKQHPKVVSCGLSWKMLGNGTGDRKVIVEGKDYYVDLMETGPNYMETNKVRLVDGRFWRNDSEADMVSTALVNEKFIEVTNIKNPINKKITLPNGQDVTVIGVIKDYKQAGAFEESAPTVIHYPLEQQFKFLAIRGNSMEDLKEIDTFCKEKWENLEPFITYTSMYETGNIQGAHNVNVSFKKTFLLAALIALILSVGGMFSLVTMFLQKRTKEIAIRKAIGSNVQSLLLLISKPYVRISIIAGVIGSVAGMLIISAVLDQIYVYHVKVKLLWYVLSASIMFIVTLLTISSVTLKAATGNPVKGLRYE